MYQPRPQRHHATSMRDILLLIATLPVLLIVHALGHSLGGRLVGFDRAALLPRALFQPPHGDDLRRRWLVTILCGPALSLMFGAQCLAVWTVLAPMLLDGSAGALLRAVAGFLFVTGAGSIALGALALVPVRMRGWRSDGWAVLRLWPAEADVADAVSDRIRP